MNVKDLREKLDIFNIYYNTKNRKNELKEKLLKGCSIILN